MSKTNIWEIHARIEPYENVFETMLPHRDQEAWTSMSFNKTETNKLEINRKYVAVAVRVSTEMNKRYTKILLAIERNGTLERRKKNERIAWGFFYYIIFFSLLLPSFSSLLRRLPLYFLWTSEFVSCSRFSVNFSAFTFHLADPWYCNNAIEQIKYKRKKKYGTFEPLVMAFPFSQKDSKYQCRTYKTLLNEIKHTNVTSA